MDALADVLKAIRLHTSTYFCSDFAPPWGMDIAAASKGLFHVVVAGECWLKAENQSQPLHLKQGDIVAFPTGGAHWLSDSPESSKLPGPLVVERVLAGDNPFAVDPLSASEQHFTLLCGSFDYDSSVKHAFLRDLPCFIHLAAADNPELSWLRTLVSVLSIESREENPGSGVIIDRLTEVLFIQLLREYMRRQQHSNDYLSALADPFIGRALNLIHGTDGSHYSVERLAQTIGLSRSAFSERFTRMVGQSPKTYMLDWHLQQAKTKLEQSELSMFEIAHAAGYASEAAFSKAFKQLFELSPGKARRQASRHA